MKINAMEAEAGQWYYGKRHGKMLCVTEATEEHLPSFAVRPPATNKIDVKYVEGELEWLPACEGWEWSRRRRVFFNDTDYNRRVCAQEVLPEDPDLDELMAACYSLIHLTCFIGDPIPDKITEAVDQIGSLLDDPLGCVLYDEPDDDDDETEEQSY